MRHLGSIVFAPVLALVALVLAGRGLTGLAETAPERPVDIFGVAAAGSAVGLAGLFLALLVMARFSPLGPGLAGAGFLTIGIWALADPAGFLALPGDQIGLTEEHLTAAATVAPLLAFPLLMTLFIPRRWLRKEHLPPEPGGRTYGQPGRLPTHTLPTHTLDDIPPVPAAPADEDTVTLPRGTPRGTPPAHPQPPRPAPANPAQRPDPRITSRQDRERGAQGMTSQAVYSRSAPHAADLSQQ